MDRVALPESRSLFARAIRWCVDFVQTPGRLEQFLRYTFVSVVSLGLDLAVFALFAWLTTMAAVLAGALSYVAGLLVHYILSVSFVFDRSKIEKSHRRLMVEYVLTGLMGIAITAAAIFLVVNIGGLPAIVGKVFGVGSSFVCVFLARAGYGFAPTRKPSAATAA